MAKKKMDRSESEYVRNEVEFLSAMRSHEPVIAIVSNDSELRFSAVEWLSYKLKKQVFVTGISCEPESSAFCRKLDPDILIGDSLKDLSLIMNEKPLDIIGSGGYIYFKKSYRECALKQWLQKENAGQYLGEAWIKLNKSS